jgi:hypothetical protein
MITGLVAPCIVLSFLQLDLPKLLVQSPFNSRDLALAANYFIAMGEEKTAKKITSLASGVGIDWARAWAADNPKPTYFSLNSRLSWMCRILYEPKGDKPLRQPLFGALSLPRHTMPLERWPHYPLALSGETYFVLGDGYRLGGLPEGMVEYLRYCQKEGTFRRKEVVVPSRVQALKDFHDLTQSDRWKAIKWRDSGLGWSYTFPEKAMLWGLRAQADEIPEK